MTLFQKLSQAKSEEDVKDAYIAALGLKSYSKNLIDIQTKEIWFEAKDGVHSTYAMFTQLMHYVQVALNKGEKIPPFLSVIDTQKAAIMKSTDVINFLEKKTIKWGKSASSYTQEALDAISAHIGAHFVSFNIKTHEEEFISTIKNAIQKGDIIRTQITPDNLKQVFDKWVVMIGVEISGVKEEDYALLFFADIMHDGTSSTHLNLPAELLHKNGAPVFSLGGKVFELGNKEGYRQFWAIYHKPPKEEHRDYLLERRDSLIPIDERSFKGAYFTPLNIVDRAYEKLNESLGNNWQKEYIVWDMCCGVGNLEIKHSNHRNIFMSTLDSEDIDVMLATKTCVSAERFQYDYLNDDINEYGEIDYNITNKIPHALRDAIKANRKILVLINPPYVEATNRSNSSNEITESKKKGVATRNNIAKFMDEYGKASNELFAQFLARIAKEIPTATIAMFSTLKYVNAPNFEKFRKIWNAKFIGGFVFPSKVFDGLTGKFPVGFLIWETDQKSNFKNLIDEISVEVLDKNIKPIGEKLFYNLPNETFLNVWFERPKSNKIDVIPLKNGITPATAKPSVTTWSNDAIAYMNCSGNDPQHTEQFTTLYSSVFGNGHGFYVNPVNLLESAIVFSVRRLIKPTWLNDRDQFLKPTEDITDEFKNDCLIWMLFNRCNRTAGANNLEWNDKKWNLVNHFIPFTENELNASGRFESYFMINFIAGITFSNEAQKVLEEGKKLWQLYFSQVDTKSVIEEYKLNRPDVGWYQVRKVLQIRNSSSMYPPVNFKQFEDSYNTLTDKLQPKVFELGFMKQ